MKIEQTILQELFRNDEYARKVLPYLKSEYFSDPKEQLIFDEVKEFVLKYNVLPKFDSIRIEVDASPRLNDSQIKECKDILETLAEDKEKDKSNVQWLTETTEKFVQERALHLALSESIEVMKDPKGNKGSIPTLLTEALAISFDPYVGHDYIGSAMDRFEFYHKHLARLPFDLKLFNLITGGGLPDKTLTVLLAGINVGKSLTMCHMSAANLAMGYDVLYITMEMAEEEIAKRIDANLLNIDIEDLLKIPKDVYEQKIEKLKQKTQGRLIIKEYPTGGASVMTFKGLLNELFLKKGFRPRIVYIDYINICASSKIKMGGSVNSYTYIKAIAEEMRGFAVENKFPIVTATQVTRSAFNDSDPDMTAIAESFGLGAAADLILAMVITDELEKLNQVMFTQLKSRLGDKNKNRRFVVGLDRPHFRLYDVEQAAQDELVEKPRPGPSEEPSSFKHIGKKFDAKKLEGVKF